MYVQYIWNILYLIRHSINVSFPYIILMTTRFINTVNMFFNMFLKKVANKVSFQNNLKHHLDILKTFLKCQIVSWVRFGVVVSIICILQQRH